MAELGGSAILIDPPTVPSLAALRTLARRPEPDCVADLLRRAPLDAPAWAAARAQARQWIEALRGARSRGSGVDALMREFSLSSQEGVALMCLAEALARIPDRATADALIRDKLAQGDWRAHIGTSRSIFVNAAAWGLMVTGKLVATHSDDSLGAAVNRLVARGGEPLIRAGVDIAMRLLGQQFVLGRTIEQALARAQEAEQRGYRHSYDMLGEAALTAQDARCYWESYAHAIAAIGASAAGHGAELAQRPGISVKLSALHPRFTAHQPDRVQAELLPRIGELCRLARGANIGLNIDAEESERLEPTLALFARLAADPALAGWDGLGIVVQAYQKRAPAVVEWLAGLAAERQRRFMVRLVKGAYWDSEIKRAQVEGQADFPVYTRKAHTDLSYLVCAQRLLAHQDRIFAQFATHNAMTLGAVLQLVAAARAGRFELQCLHGMGETLYDRVVGSEHLGLACRIYAPVGSHETLLAYLVRRLLENGANSSFVNRVVDETVPVEALLEDPVAAGRLSGGRAHPAIVLPGQLYAPLRHNSRGIDLYDVPTLAGLEQAFAASAARAWTAFPILASDRFAPAAPEPRPVRNPARRAHVVGTVHEASEQDVESALQAAQSAAHLQGWGASDGAHRAAVLDAVADAFEQRRDDLLWLAVAEAGKTIADAAAEVREAVDFCRYYAVQARSLPADPGAPLGTVVAISPWNFPLAIFTGQLAAALAAGNAVLAKPAEQTPLIAALAVRLMHGAGVPRASLQLLPGDGGVGALLTRDPRVRAVLFTGSTEVACRIDQALAAAASEGAADADAVLVAETGGQNAMIVDSSAQPEQVVQDALLSAFGSAGQRCSALRILCLQEEIAGPVLAMLTGAAAELRLGDPADLATDVGPVIDAAARAAIESHVGAFAPQHVLARVLPPAGSAALAAEGHFVAPAIIEIDSIAQLEREVFGPVLHVLRYRREALGELVDAINATGYGLTCGIHSRIDETIAFIQARIRAGNVYVNRNMIGAVVGVQPFGGEGLSGTGPKAGGPWTVARLQRPRGVLSLAPLALGAARIAAAPPLLRELQAWLHASGHAALAALCDEYSVCTPIGCRFELSGPTGESNALQYRPRGRVLCLGDEEAPRDPGPLLGQLAAVAATGNRALLLDGTAARRVVARLPEAMRACIDWTGTEGTAQEAGGGYELVLVAGTPERTRELARVLRRTLAQRAGARIPVLRVQEGRYALDRMVAEQVITINTAAAGGNATLMSLKPL
jgi:RHH-type proline utilization regulon transcriptional repressor/proline dehydrogenase/delta 1-pyrroline-5-carboxylate dehydrogenase